MNPFRTKDQASTSSLRACPICGSNDFALRLKEESFFVVRCRSCALVYLGNPPDRDQLYEEYYDSSEPEPTEYRNGGSNKQLSELCAINNQRVRQIQSIKPTGRLLDVGCGRGFFVRTANENGYRAEGIDVSRRAVDYAKSKFAITASTLSLAEIESSGERFDIITLWHVLEHFTDPVGALQQVRTILTPRGVCVVEVPNLHSLKFILARNKWEGGNHPLYHRTFFTARTLSSLFRRCNFIATERSLLSYQIPDRSRSYHLVKRALNLFALDSFLTLVAYK